jgi:phosphoribosylamine--glycine ligase
MATRGTPYRGVLYAGLMRTAEGIRVLEFNCRFGDPEAQVLLPLLETDLYEALAWCAGGADGSASPAALRWRAGAAAGVVLATPGYPDAPVVGAEIVSTEGAPGDVLLFHGATKYDDAGRLVTAGGRVMTVVGVDATVGAALRRCMELPVSFAGMHYRRDIGVRAARTEAIGVGRR